VIDVTRSVSAAGFAAGFESGDWRRRTPRRFAFVLLAFFACTKEAPPPPPARPSILLVTLDTTRADAIGAATPTLNALAARGRRFTQAYTTAPQTLPSHSSMMTGLYPAGHGVHENARHLGDRNALLAERLRGAGYRTAAFVSGFPLARRFGLARGFDVYDDEFENERSSRDTTDRAIAWLAKARTTPVFFWVHYYDPHDPYEPPEPFRSRYASNPYLGEVAAMDEQLGRLLGAFGDGAVIIAADHGEGLGDHGEAKHGYLLYQSVMHVPLVLAGPGIERGTSDSPVSTRRIFHTILDWAGLGAENSLRAPSSEVVLGEAMAPFLDFGWQPQVMAVERREKAISAGKLEIYDVIADPAETRDLAARGTLSRDVRKVLAEYPLPSAEAAEPANMSDEERRRFAALGYITSAAKPVVRKDAPRPRDMAHLFDDLERASTLFVREQYAAAIPVLEKIVREDPYNLTTLLRLAAAHSSLGHNEAALAAFRKAQAIAPDSEDVRMYLALHYARGKEWPRAVAMLERVVAESPDRLPALEALADIREKQGRLADALALRRTIETMRAPGAADLVHDGELAMELGDTPAAISHFERARTMQGSGFKHDLELGVLYLAARRLENARTALDRVPPSHPAYAMALFKRAQVSVLLNEPDRAARIESARKHADDTTRGLIANERLFR